MTQFWKSYRHHFILGLRLSPIVMAVLACNFPMFQEQPPAQVTQHALTFLPDPVRTDTPQAVSTPTLVPADTQPPLPTLDYQPVFEPGVCAFPLPAGESPVCGYLVVPVSRASVDSRFIRLHVAIFHSRSKDPAPDPVVHLAGGPGSSSLGVARYLFQQGLGSILERRDFILFDQRGAGYSQPRLDCPEREELTPNLLDGSLPIDQAGQAIVEAFERCRARLVREGIDLSAYNSAASAADLDDLRTALGYSQLNLYGVSYGSRLALTMMRDYPTAVRSVLLDSTYPPQVNLYTHLAPNAERAFEVFFTRCASNPGCRAGYPDLRSVFYDLVDELNASPLRVNLEAGGARREVQLDGGLLIDVLFVGLYNPVVTASMPKMIYEIRQGDTLILQERLRLYFDEAPAIGMQMAVQCFEEMPFNAPEEAYTAARGVQPQIAAFFPDSVQPLFLACRDWNPGMPDAIENQPVHSDLPTLILAGEHDPITPPEWGSLAAETLSNAHFFLFPGHGHWATRSSRCAVDMALAFWDDPTAAPDAACIQNITPLDFVH